MFNLEEITTMQRKYQILTKTFALAIAFGIFAAPTVTQADSKKWRANNHTDENVKVLFRATGCAGVKEGCDGNDKTLVCASKNLSPGEETSYEFEDSTSSRSKEACLRDRDKSNWAVTDDRKANELYLNDSKLLKWVNE
ncbi:MAG TPA: hypothetical protein DC046_11735 [Rhodospirillaceae bacterium]|nr:hypothetical protein [Rhodospirillaceae bacterium]